MTKTVELRFKVKPQLFEDGSIRYLLPAEVKPSHCADLPTWRKSSHGNFIRPDRINDYMRWTLGKVGLVTGQAYFTDELPSCVNVDTSKFLHVITVTLEDTK